MNCEKFDRYRAGDMTAGKFACHVRDCPECREQAALDAQLEREIAALREPIAAEGLWERIETSLGREKKLAAARGANPVPGRRRPGAFSFRRWFVLAPAGAALLALLVLGINTFRKPPAPSGILASAALSRVETKEKEYLGAIEDLEREARPKLAAMDLQMMSLYRDKLATIDAQIGRCREALDSNPANAHIRRYLLAALQDKRQTLADILGSTNQVNSERS
jgi:hypothetical protein